MPFFVYTLAPLPSGTIIANQPHRVRLAGTAGPFYRHAQPGFSGASGNVLCWHLDEPQILGLLNEPPANHALIVDLKPYHPTEVSLYRLRQVWGHSESIWTPLALQFEALFVDKPEQNVHAFKARFEMPATAGALIHEFLYLRGGTQRGHWTWGRNGTVNATLLWPHVYKWFTQQIAPFVP